MRLPVFSDSPVSVVVTDHSDIRHPSFTLTNVERISTGPESTGVYGALIGVSSDSAASAFVNRADEIANGFRKYGVMRFSHDWSFDIRAN